MKRLVIFALWRHKLPALAAVATMAFIFLWPSIPLGSVKDWLRFFVYYTPQNYLYALMTLLSGLYVGAYVFNKTVVRCCAIENARVGASGSLIGMLLGACPACIPALAFLFPLSITIFLSRLSIIFLLISIALMLFSIRAVGGFKKETV